MGRTTGSARARSKKLKREYCQYCQCNPKTSIVSLLVMFILIWLFKWDLYWPQEFEDSFSQIKKTMSTLQSLCQLEKFEGFFLLPWTYTLYVWLIHPYELLTLHMYDPVSEGTKSFRLNQVVHGLKDSLWPLLLSLNKFPSLYHFTVGRGFPSAEQSSFTEFPTGTWRRLRLILFCDTVNLGAAVKRRTATAFERWTSRQLPGSHPLLTHFKLESKHYFILSVLQYWSFDDSSEFYHMRGKITECRFAETESIFFLITWALLVIKRAWLLDADWAILLFAARIYWLQCNWMKPCM